MRSVRIKEKAYPQGGCAKLAWLIASIYWVLLYFFRKLACLWTNPSPCSLVRSPSPWCQVWDRCCVSHTSSPSPPPRVSIGVAAFWHAPKIFRVQALAAGVSLQTVLSQPERRFLEGEQLFPFSFSTRVWKPPRAVGINLPDLVSHLQARRSAPLALGGLVVGLDNHISWKTSVPINPMGLKGPFQPPPSHGARVNA